MSVMERVMTTLHQDWVERGWDGMARDLTIPPDDFEALRDSCFDTRRGTPLIVKRADWFRLETDFGTLVIRRGSTA